MNFRGKEYKLSVILPWVSSVLKGFKLKLATCILLSWIIVGLNFVFVWLTKLAIDSATGSHSDMHVIMAACASLVGVTVLQAAISVIRTRLRTVSGFDMNRKMQERLLQATINADWSEINGYHTGDIVRRFETDGSTITSFLGNTVPTMLYALLQLGGAFVFLVILNIKIAVALVVIMAVGLAVSKYHFMKIRSFSQRIKECGSMLQAALQEGLQGISVLKALSGKRLYEEHYSHLFKTQRDNVKSRLRYTVFSSTMLNVGFAACYLLVFIWGVLHLGTGAITYGTLMAFVQLVGQIQSPTRTLVSSITEFAEFYTSCERLNEIARISQDSEETEVELHNAPSIIGEHLTYSYEQGKKNIYNDYNFEFKAGKLTAITGTTGAGKTTLMRLLMAYVKPDYGHIYICSESSRTEISAATRSLFAYVPQGDTLFSMTLRENLRLSRPDATDSQMREALQWACADFLKRHPEGLDMPCGEHGKGLSEGQAQRLCIARALLSKAPILLMDEATSALDRDTERQILSNISEHIKNKTILFITHRDTVMQFADEVVSIG